MENIIIAFLTGVCGPVIILVVKYYLSKLKRTDPVVETLKISSLVTTKIEHLKDLFHADRIWITQFHNGGHFYPTGKSITKFSVIYEVVSVGTNSIQTNFQNIPVNLFSKSINYLLENDVIEISDFKNEAIPTHGLKYIAEETGCKSSYLFAIKTIDEKFIGVLGVDFTKEVVNLTHDEVNEIAVHASSIGGVLFNHS